MTAEKVRTLAKGVAPLVALLLHVVGTMANRVRSNPLKTTGEASHHGVMGVLRSAAIFLHTVACSVVSVLVFALTRKPSASARVMDWWGKRFIRLGGWKVHVEGLEHLPSGGAILVSNHQSLVDIPLFLSTVPGPVKFLAKRELGRIPLFGRAMVAGGNLLVDRDDPRSAVHLMREASERLQRGERLVVFPEGTRSADGSVGEFKPGAFVLAQRSEAPVLPVALDGGVAALPKGSLVFRPAVLSVRILPPLPRDGRLSRQAMADEARQRIRTVREGIASPVCDNVGPRAR